MTITITDKATLPQWKGKPVPWVTQWSGEIVDIAISVSLDAQGRLHLSYKDGLENRDHMNVLWKREGLARSGDPQFAQLNTYRQRASMLRALCQVCGSKIDERPIRWLMAAEQLNVVQDGSAVTMSPPTCSACIPLALDLCPFLRTNKWVILKVLEYEPWGVYGEAVKWDEEKQTIRDLRGVRIPYEGSAIPMHAIVAFQQMVRLTKFVIEEES